MCLVLEYETLRAFDKICFLLFIVNLFQCQTFGLRAGRARPGCKTSNAATSSGANQQHNLEIFLEYYPASGFTRILYLDCEEDIEAEKPRPVVMFSLDIYGYDR